VGINQLADPPTNQTNTPYTFGLLGIILRDNNVVLHTASNRVRFVY